MAATVKGTLNLVKCRGRERGPVEARSSCCSLLLAIY